MRLVVTQLELKPRKKKRKKKGLRVRLGGPTSQRDDVTGTDLDDGVHLAVAQHGLVSGGPARAAAAT